MKWRQHAKNRIAGLRRSPLKHKKGNELVQKPDLDNQPTAARVYDVHLRNERAVAILKIIVLLMIPFCWVALHDFDGYPREGHFLFLSGMPLTLFSTDIS